MFNLIATPFAYIMRLIYGFVENYGLTIILFTALTKLILWPLNRSSQKSLMGMQKIQPELQKLQEKYKNDKDKLGQETMKLYQEHNINPMGGCLPMLIQFPLIIAIYQVVTKPITYLMNGNAAAMNKELGKLGYEVASKNLQEIDVIRAIQNNGLAEKIKDFIEIDFNFLGLDLSLTPQQCLGDWKTNFIWIIPVVSLLSAWAMSKLSAAQSTNKSDAQAQQTQKTMTLLMPLMSGYFTLILPAGVGLYWIASNVFQMIQQYITTLQLRKEQVKSEEIPGAIDVKAREMAKKKKKK